MEIAVALDGGAWRRYAAGDLREGRLSLGRGAECQVRLPAPEVAERHAELVVDGSALWICALEPLWLEDKLLSGWSSLEGDARLKIGPHLVLVRAGGAGAGAELSAPRWSAAAARLPDPEEQQRSDRLLALSDRFALPPDEEDAAQEAPRPPFLKQRFLNVGSGIWILASASVVMALVAVTSRRTPLALASRALTTSGPQVEQQARPVAGPATRPAPVTPGEMRVAAESLIARDDDTALRIYRMLAARDPRFLPFARALEQRQRRRELQGKALEAQ